jgi:hypothetical protein
MPTWQDISEESCHSLGLGEQTAVLSSDYIPDPLEGLQSRMWDNANQAYARSFQWMVLQRQVHRSGWWVLASAVGGAVVMAVGWP